MRKFWLRKLRPLLQEIKRYFCQEQASLSVPFHRIRFGLAYHVVEQFQEPSRGLLSIPDALDESTTHSHYFYERHVWQLKDVFLDPKSGGLTVNGKSVLESSGGSATKPRYMLRKPLIAVFQPLFHPVILTGQRPANYYHWLIEDLPCVIRASKRFPDATALVWRNQPNWVRESLDLYQIPWVEHNRPGYFRNVVLAGRAQDTGWPHPDDVDLLRSKLEDLRTDSFPGKKVYVSRSNSKRALGNEESLQAALAELGFEICFLEELSVDTQAKMFRGASIVVGPHGAGLSNIVFMPKGGRLIELVWESHAIQCFEVLAIECGINYDRLIIRSESKGSSPKLDDSGLQKLFQLLQKG